MKNRRKIIFSIINIVMSDFGIKVIINIIIGIIVFGGFFIFFNLMGYSLSFIDISSILLYNNTYFKR